MCCLSGWSNDLFLTKFETYDGVDRNSWLDNGGGMRTVECSILESHLILWTWTFYGPNFWSLWLSKKKRMERAGQTLLWENFFYPSRSNGRNHILNLQYERSIVSLPKQLSGSRLVSFFSGSFKPLFSSRKHRKHKFPVTPPIAHFPDHWPLRNLLTQIRAKFPLIFNRFSYLSPFPTSTNSVFPAFHACKYFSKVLLPFRRATLPSSGLSTL